MATLFGQVIAGTVDRAVRWVIVPVAGVIPWVVSRGLLLAGFAVLWLAVGVAMFADPAALDAAWAWIGGLPLPLQAVAWLLFLPLMAGMWVWAADWPLVVRVVVIAGIAGWNLLVFFPRRGAASPVAAR